MMNFVRYQYVTLYAEYSKP